ncbi:MAG: AAA family ATPase [Magnetococcales bacterium]|nr:AAA family ATPase [Magnetococcales bacterium]NGZ27193.1 AAA family ATPase [Magnetococcales bacterium]
MAKLEGIRIRNFRSLQDVTLGRLWHSDPSVEPLTSLTVVIGKNGVGKSSLFDAFGFLADCLRTNVEEACDMRGRGGFERIRSQGQKGPIVFELYYRESLVSRHITYGLEIDADQDGLPFVSMEVLGQRRKGLASGPPFFFFILSKGKGWAWKEEEVSDFGIESGQNWDDSIKEVVKKEDRKAEAVSLVSSSNLGVATVGSLKQHPRIAAFRQFLESWYLSYFTPDAARTLPVYGMHKHLNTHGDNLANVVQFMEREHKDRFQSILERIAERIPGIQRIDTEKTPDGRLLLRFHDRGFQAPFYVHQMSDGTLKLFAYLLLLENPTPPPFICIEEPENGLYHKLLATLAAEFRRYAEDNQAGSQLFVTTHQPYLVDALNPQEVWILEKGEDGFTTIRRASEDPLVVNLVAEGLPLGNLWFSDYLDAR